jgi:DNA-binding transcriptional MerR regulator
MSDGNLDEDYLSVKEFAEIVGMSASALRHYDNKGIFRPAKRGGDLKNKYRYYAPTQITTVKMIRVLAELGVPLQTIEELATERTPEKLMKLLSRHKDTVAVELSFLREAFSVIDTFLELLHAGISAAETEILVSETPEKRIILGDVNDFSGSVGFYGEFARFCNAPHEPELNLSYPVGGYFESMDVFLSEPSRPTRFFSLDPKGHERKPAGTYLIGHTRGHYGRTNDLPRRMAGFAKKNGAVFDGPVYNLYLFDELSVADPNRYLLRASASVREPLRALPRRSLRRLRRERTEKP